MRSTVVVATVLHLILASPAAAFQAAPSWNVSERHGPGRDVEFETDEATWMSLDVSPDGQTIVFDLLGDIYVMPIGGGEARAIASQWKGEDDAEAVDAADEGASA